MKPIRQTLANHKYLMHTAALTIGLLGMIAYRSDSVEEFISNTGNVALLAISLSFGIFIMQMLISWMFFPIFPKREDFDSDKSHQDWFNHEGELESFVFPMMVVVVAIVVAFQLP